MIEVENWQVRLESNLQTWIFSHYPLTYSRKNVLAVVARNPDGHVGIVTCEYDWIGLADNSPDRVDRASALCTVERAGQGKPPRETQLHSLECVRSHISGRRLLSYFIVLLFEVTGGSLQFFFEDFYSWT